MGVRRVQIAELWVAVVLRHGPRVSDVLEPIADAKVLDVRFHAAPHLRQVELLIESPSFDGPDSDGHWPAIAEGRWDEFPIFLPRFRPFEVLPSSVDADVVDDPDDRRGEIEGA